LDWRQPRVFGKKTSAPEIPQRAEGTLGKYALMVKLTRAAFFLKRERGSVAGPSKSGELLCARRLEIRASMAQLHAESAKYTVCFIHSFGRRQQGTGYYPPRLFWRSFLSQVAERLAPSGLMSGPDPAPSARGSARSCTPYIEACGRLRTGCGSDRTARSALGARTCRSVLSSARC
jgi:hypothetical protein